MLGSYKRFISETRGLSQLFHFIKHQVGLAGMFSIIHFLIMFLNFGNMGSVLIYGGRMLKSFTPLAMKPSLLMVSLRLGASNIPWLLA